MVLFEIVTYFIFTYEYIKKNHYLIDCEISEYLLLSDVLWKYCFCFLPICKWLILQKCSLGNLINYKVQFLFGFLVALKF